MGLTGHDKELRDGLVVLSQGVTSSWSSLRWRGGLRAGLGAGRAGRRLLETSRPETVDVSSGGVRPVRFSAGFQREPVIMKGLAVGGVAKQLG